MFVRTRRHPTVDWLEREEEIVFSRSFDALYDSKETFEDVYAAMVEAIAQALQSNQLVGFAVPGHPLFGESAVGTLIEMSKEASWTVEIVESVSYIDTVACASRTPIDELTVVDAMSIPDVTNPFATSRLPFDPLKQTLVYQIYDTTLASATKLALLEVFPPDHVVKIIDGASTEPGTLCRECPLSEIDRPRWAWGHLSSMIVPALEEEMAPRDFQQLVDIVARLRDPNGGCPWDREQTPESLKRYMIEEAYEVVEAVDGDDPDAYADELGDVLLQVALHSQLARERGDFDIQNPIDAIVRKMIRRHPHVFGDATANSSAQVLAQWAVIKRSEKKKSDHTSILHGAPASLPALSYAQELSRRVVKVGFEWPDIDGVVSKLDEELSELREAIAGGDMDHAATELGDLLFTAVNVARYMGIEAELCLRSMIARFRDRFAYIEEGARLRGIGVADLSPSEMEELWEEAKQTMK
jgi:tetrapyrrole methylase family protein/MazG family protein